MALPAKFWSVIISSRGKGGAFMRTKYRNLITGSVVEQNFRSGIKFPKPDIEVREMQYLYNEGDGYAFMDMTTYDQISPSRLTLSATRVAS